MLNGAFNTCFRYNSTTCFSLHFIHGNVKLCDRGLFVWRDIVVASCCKVKRCPLNKSESSKQMEFFSLYRWLFTIRYAHLMFSLIKQHLKFASVAIDARTANQFIYFSISNGSYIIDRNKDHSKWLLLSISLANHKMKRKKLIEQAPRSTCQIN